MSDAPATTAGGSRAARGLAARGLAARGRWLPIAVLAVTVLGTSYLRLAHLGANELWNDELYHYFAAQALKRGEGPLLPSGEVYDRGLDITHMVAFTTDHFSPIETASRLPTAVFGVLNVVLFAAVAWCVAGPWAAVAAALLLGIYPEAVFQSRYTRFYTYQLNFGLVAFYAGWQLVRRAGRRAPIAGAELATTWAWAAVALVALGLAARVQLTTLSTAVGLGVAVGLAAAVDLVARGRRAWLDSVPLALAAVAVLAVLFLILRHNFFGWVDYLIRSSQFVPLWRRRLAPDGGSPLEYYWMLSAAFPLVISLAPVLFAVVALRNWRLATYLSVWFAVPFLIHSFLLPWKQTRFIFLAVPGLFLLAAIALAIVWERAYALVAGALEARGVRGPRAPRLLAGAAVTIAALFAIATTPAFNQSRKMLHGNLGPSTTDDYRAIARIIREIPGSDSIPLGTGSPLRSLLYWPRVDFVVRRSFLERPKPGGAEWQDRFPTVQPEGTPDFYTGAPVIPSPSGIRQRFAAQGAVIILPDEVVEHGNIPRLLDTLEAKGVEICRGRCGTAKVYYWNFSGKVPSGLIDSTTPVLQAAISATTVRPDAPPAPRAAHALAHAAGRP
jgi:hypothetical protein